jgi:hypothetical protein
MRWPLGSKADPVGGNHYLLAERTDFAHRFYLTLSTELIKVGLSITIASGEATFLLFLYIQVLIVFKGTPSLLATHGFFLNDLDLSTLADKSDGIVIKQFNFTRLFDLQAHNMW